MSFDLESMTTSQRYRLGIVTAALGEPQPTDHNALVCYRDRLVDAVYQMELTASLDELAPEQALIATNAITALTSKIASVDAALAAESA